MEGFIMFKGSPLNVRLLFTAVIIFGTLLFAAACSGEESANSGADESASDVDFIENGDEASGISDDKEDFINKSIYSLPDYEEVLKKYQSFAFTSNGHENRFEFLGEEEVNGVMTEHYYLKVANDFEDREYEIWMNDEGFAERGSEPGSGEYDEDIGTGDIWIGKILEPFYEFNVEFRYPIDYDDFTVESHDTATDTLLEHDVVIHTVKGVDKYSGDDGIEYEVTVAEAADFEFILEYMLHDGHDEKKVYELTEMELR